MYYNKDGSGHAIALNSVSVASALEAILAGTARPKHSRNRVERVVHVRFFFSPHRSWVCGTPLIFFFGQSLNASLVRFERLIVAYPYWTALGFIALIGGLVAVALSSPLKDEHIDWEAEKRLTKGGRLD